MSRNGPFLTLLAGAAVATALLVASIAATDGRREGDQPALADDAGGGEASPSPAPSPAGSDPAPSPTPAPEPVTYVGTVDGGGASVAIIVAGEDTVAYVCDGAAAEEWLHGLPEGNALELSGDDGSLVAEFDERRATGETTVAGRTWTFTVEQVDAPDGLYRFAETVVGGAEVAGGWIVLPDGTQVGVLTVDGEPRPAPELDPATGEVTVAGQLIAAQRQGEPEEGR